jgi:hypothetical protein
MRDQGDWLTVRRSVYEAEMRELHELRRVVNWLRIQDAERQAQMDMVVREIEELRNASKSTLP